MCSYCNGDKWCLLLNQDASTEISAQIHDNRLVLLEDDNSIDELRIGYCPMCGRELKLKED